MLDDILDRIAEIQREAREHGFKGRPAWPVLILKTPKGWTGPKEINGKKAEGSFRAHQVPMEEVRTKPENMHILEGWIKSYRPEELFDERGTLRPEPQRLAPKRERRMGANPVANGKTNTFHPTGW